MLQRWTTRFCSLLLILSLLPAAWGQTPTATETVATSTEAKAALDKGRTRDRARRWGEALQYYEQAVKSHPNRRELEERLVMARSHYDITRRYGDDSYLRTLG